MTVCPHGCQCNSFTVHVWNNLGVSKRIYLGRCRSHICLKELGNILGISKRLSISNHPIYLPGLSAACGEAIRDSPVEVGSWNPHYLHGFCQNIPARWLALGFQQFDRGYFRFYHRPIRLFCEWPMQRRNPLDVMYCCTSEVNWRQFCGEFFWGDDNYMYGIFAWFLW